MKKTDLRKILAHMRISVPEELEKELLEQFGKNPVDAEGHQFQYTEQDVYEQMRKKLRTYEQRTSNPTMSAFR